MSRTDIKERLLSKRKILDNGCWEYTGQRLPKGYGRIHFKGKKRLTHRVAAHIWHNMDIDAPREIQVLHHCDYKPCFNPDHIYVGDHKQNFEDAIDRNRIKRGEENGANVLKESDILNIRQLALEMQQKDIASMYNVSKQHISRIVARKNWGWLE